MCKAAASALAVISLCKPYLSAARGNNHLHPSSGSLMQNDGDTQHAGAFASPTEWPTFQTTAPECAG